MRDTIVEHQDLRLKEKIQRFFSKTVIRSQKPCLIKDVLAASLDKWSLFVIYNLGYHEVLRFSELESRIAGISSRMLSRTLKKLETHAIVSRKVYPEVPPRVEYRLTEFGSGFAGQLIDLSQWYMDHYSPSEQ